MRDAQPAGTAAALDAEIGGAMAWTCAALGPAAGGVALTAEGLAEIDAAVALMRANPLPALALAPRDFPLPALQRTMAEVTAHRRTAFRDWPEPDRKRHLVRLWLRDAGRAFYNG